jgi:hypothetical protein
MLPERVLKMSCTLIGKLLPVMKVIKVGGGSAHGALVSGRGKDRVGSKGARSWSRGRLPLNHHDYRAVGTPDASGLGQAAQV